jgi:hypothetical protein
MIYFHVYAPDKWVRQEDTQSQSRQRARLFLQSSGMGLPHPLSPRRVCPPFGSEGGGGANSLAREGGGSLSREGTDTVVL